MLNVFWNLAVFISTLGTLITVHEFGHFFVARRFGVLVKRFSIGFGKPLWRYIDCYGTEFVISLIPLGGYVKMLDEPIEAILPEMHHYAFNKKNFSQRVAIIASGPIANFIFSIFAYWMAFIIGLSSVRPIVGEISAGSVAENARIIPGMELKAIDGIETPDWDSVRLQIIDKIGHKQAIIRVLPLGSSQPQEKVLDLRKWSFKSKIEDPITSLGIYPRDIRIETVLAEVKNCCAARKAGLQVGDKILKVDGHPLKQWNTFVNLVRNSLNKPLDLEVERKGTLLSLILIPEKKPGSRKQEGFAGVIPKATILPNNYDSVYKYKPFSAIVKAFDKTWRLTKLTINMLWKLITGNVKLNNLSGPISIAQGAGMSAKFGMTYYLSFLALISINLGVINLFPLPVLDGGQLLFLGIEQIKGSPISTKIRDVCYRISLFFLALLMGFSLFNDFSRL